MLEQHPIYLGYYVNSGKELNPKESGCFRFVNNWGFFGCAGVLTVSIHCSCDCRCEFVVAMAFRNYMIQFTEGSGNKFAVTFMDNNARVDEKSYFGMIDGKNAQMAYLGCKRIKHNNVLFSIHMGSEYKAILDVKLEEPNTEHLKLK